MQGMLQNTWKMVAKFLSGLFPEYFAIKINILTSDEIPDLSEVFYYLNIWI